MQPQTMIAVADVEASSAFYQKLLGCKKGHGGREYERLLDPQGRMILQLHDFDTHHHPHLGQRDVKPYGNGVLLWFEVDDFDRAVARAKQLGAKVLEDVKVNPNARHRELWLSDPDGYTVVLAGHYGDI